MISTVKLISYQRILSAFLVATFISYGLCSNANGQHPYDDFQDGTTMNWFGVPVTSTPDAGPDGVGDFAIFCDADGSGVGGRLIIYNTVQWVFDWTANGVKQVTFDIRNPNTNDLTIGLGMAGDGLPGPFGSGPTFVSNTQVVIPADNNWHTVTFDVLADDWSPYGGQSTIEAALQDVRHFRILHNPTPLEFLGAFTTDDFYVDNVRTVKCATADSHNVLLGTPTTGTHDDTLTSDDERLCTLTGHAFSPFLPSLIVQFDGTLATDSPNELSVCVEAQVNDFGIEQSIQCFNYVSGSFETVDTRPASRNVDETVKVALTGDVTRFVQAGTGSVRMRVNYKSDGSGFFAAWQGCIDYLAWEYE